jgi:tRNA-dihydrouridine synthase A
VTEHQLTPPPLLERRFAVAPMLNYTDRHFRYLVRLITQRFLLYTEMITTSALKHGKYQQLLAYDPLEHPLALQLGGSGVEDLRDCARLAADHGFDEINLNVGCPSDRVQAGKMGACLMLEPELVADCVASMQAAVKIPVTVKCRIGVDQHDSYLHLYNFISKVAEAGSKVFIIHARKAWLHGLSPKENRTIPPLRYDLVKQLKQDLPQLNIILNGGINNLALIKEQLLTVDGVMIGREAYKNPYFLAAVERHYYPSTSIPAPAVVLGKYLAYIAQQLANKVPLRVMTQHLPGLWHGQPGATALRCAVLAAGQNSGGGLSALKQILTTISYASS